MTHSQPRIHMLHIIPSEDASKVCIVSAVLTDNMHTKLHINVFRSVHQMVPSHSQMKQKPVVRSYALLEFVFNGNIIREDQESFYVNQKAR